MPRKEPPPNLEKILTLGVKTIETELTKLKNKSEAQAETLDTDESICAINYTKAIAILMKQAQVESNELSEFSDEELRNRFNNLSVDND